MDQKKRKNNNPLASFKKWYEGNDLLIGEVEMRVQDEAKYTPEERAMLDAEKRAAASRAFEGDGGARARIFKHIYRLICGVFAVSFALILLSAVSRMPAMGNAANPTNNEVPERYIEKGLEETGAVNAVTGMILDYRAFDTLGESHVLFIATCCVLLMLRVDKKGLNSADIRVIHDEEYEAKSDVILKFCAKVFVPVVIIFGLYVILCGHLGPGGGFSGGAIIGAGLILYLSAFGFEATERFFNMKIYRILSFAALATYSISKLYSFYCGANHLETGIPLGTPGAILSSGLIFVLNICVGIVVACTMFTFYVMFRRGDY